MCNQKIKKTICGRCGNKPSVIGKTRCQACVDYDKKRSKLVRDQRRLSGKCAICGGEKTGRYISLRKCKSCSENSNEARKASKKLLKSMGVCSCGQKVHTDTLCLDCLKRKKDNILKYRKNAAAKILKNLKRRKPKQGKDPYGFVYKVICQDNNKIYIGQTVDFNERQSGHIRKAFNQKVNTPFANALRKYGKKNFSWEVIHDCYDKKELNYWEWHYINKFDSFCGKNGYNLLDGVLN